MIPFAARSPRKRAGRDAAAVFASLLRREGYFKVIGIRRIRKVLGRLAGFLNAEEALSAGAALGVDGIISGEVLEDIRDTHGEDHVTKRVRGSVTVNRRRRGPRRVDVTMRVPVRVALVRRIQVVRLKLRFFDVPGRRLLWSGKKVRKVVINARGRAIRSLPNRGGVWNGLRRNGLRSLVGMVSPHRVARHRRLHDGGPSGVGRGAGHYRDGRLMAATRAWSAVLRADPRSWRALANLGLVYERRGAYRRAVRHYRRALKLKPQSAYLRRALYEAGRSAAAQRL